MSAAGPDAALCPACFADRGGAARCPHCRHGEGGEARDGRALPLGHLLGGQFVIGRVLGKPGGFGITYMGWDRGLHRRVAIKEYLPDGFASRAPGGLDVRVEPHAADFFAHNRERFLDEGRTLARLDHPNIVRVYQVLEAHGTACLVMAYYPGETLKEHLIRHGGRLREAAALALLGPVLDGLAAVHEAGLLHRDIKPDNVYLAAARPHPRPVLIDFGAARQTTFNRTQVQTQVITSEGWSPPEQYDKETRLGPPTDLYAVAATFYCCVTGQFVPRAEVRLLGRPLEPARAFGVSAALSDALDAALALRPERRPRTVAAFRALLPLDGEAPPRPLLAALWSRFGGGRAQARPAADGQPRRRPAEPAPAAAKAPIPPAPPPPAAPVAGPSVQDTGARLAAERAAAERALAEQLARQAEAKRAREAELARVKAGREAAERALAERLAREAEAKRERDAELARLAAEREAAERALAARLAKEAAEQQAHAAEVARLAAEREAAERALAARLAQEAAEQRAHAAEVARLAAERAAAERALAEPLAKARAVRQRPSVERLPFEPEMIAIPAGRFLMGSPKTEPGNRGGEGSQHWVQVPAFEIGKYAVTFDQWDACVADGGCSHRPADRGWGRGNRPVIDVSWDDIQQYIAWLNRKTGRHYRLPSEAEWEYAARAGTTTAFSTGDCIHTSQANYNGNHGYNNCGAKTGVYLGKTQPVGSYPANPWGLYDMHGNVWEWVEDCWHDDYKGAPADGSAWLGIDGGPYTYRVLRGGHWFGGPMNARAAYRFWCTPNTCGNGLGFRVARRLSP